MNIMEKIDKYLMREDSTKDAFETLKKAIKFYESNDSLDSKGKEVLKTLKGIKDYYDKEGSFSPDQAKTIFNVSQGISKMTGK